MQMSHSVLRLVGAVVSFGLIAYSFPAAAIEYGGFGGRPAYPRSDNPRTESIFIHTLEPGAVQGDGIKVINNTSEPKTVMLYAADSTPSTGGAFACEQLDENKDGVGAWITLSKTEITLQPATNEVVPFEIKVPASAGVGEHNGCILIQEKKEKTSNQSGANISVRTGLRVAVTVPGSIVRQLVISGFEVSKKGKDFLLHPRVSNSGNVSIDADVKVATYYFFGAKLFEHGGQYPVLRAETSDWNFELKQPFWGGWYRADLKVTYDSNAEAGVGKNSGKALTVLSGEPVWFFSWPTWPALMVELGVLLILVGLLVIWWLRGRRNNWIKSSWGYYTVQEGDDLNNLAKHLQISWKLLAKANKIKAPYVLKPGSQIKLPPHRS